MSNGGRRRNFAARSWQEPGLLQEAQAGQRLGLPILRLRARLITEAGGGEGAETAQGVLADYGWSEVRGVPEVHVVPLPLAVWGFHYHRQQQCAPVV